MAGGWGEGHLFIVVVVFCFFVEYTNAMRKSTFFLEILLQEASKSECFTNGDWVCRVRTYWANQQRLIYFEER